MNVLVVDKSYIYPFPGKDARTLRAVDASGTLLPKTTLQWVQHVQKTLAAMLRINCVELSTDDFRSFELYWKHVNSGGRKPASEFTKRRAPHEHAR